MGFEEEMEQYDDQFMRDAASGGILPDGEYPDGAGNGPAQIVESRVEENDRGFSWIIKFQADYQVQAESGPMTVTGTVRKWQGLDNEVGRSIAAQDSRRLGYEGKLSGLKAACESGMFDDLICEIVVKTKPGDTRDFTNVYINNVLGKGDAAKTQEARTPAPVGADDDIPF